MAQVQHPLQDGLQEAVGHDVSQPHLMAEVAQLQVRVCQTSALLSGKPNRIYRSGHQIHIKMVIKETEA